MENYQNLHLSEEDAIALVGAWSFLEILKQAIHTLSVKRLQVFLLIYCTPRASVLIAEIGCNVLDCTALLRFC